MEKYLSQPSLEKLYKKELKNSGADVVKNFKESNSFNKNQHNAVSIFLCHSHLDKTIVDKVLIILKQLRGAVYVDWMDEMMPTSTNHTTASLIKDKIDKCDKFIFLATVRALSSKWCNWELGLAFSLKAEKDFAILPIESKSGNWPGNEYLGLYPTMKLRKYSESENIDADHITIIINKQTLSLNDWLHS